MAFIGIFAENLGIQKVYKMAKTVNVITMGCSKNLVDSERLMKQLDANHFSVVHDSENKAEVVIINTCGFINDAKEESIEMILRYCKLKKKKQIEKLFVIGCLSQRWADELRNEIPDVDQFFGTNDLDKILKALNAEVVRDVISERIITTPKHLAYLKIAEGCNRSCSFCSIPIIRGAYNSKTISELVEETKILVGKGVKETMIIAQDLSFYGVDLNGKQQLPELLDQLSRIDGLEWIRLHYLYPNDFPRDILQLMAERKNICKYMDLPFQHVSDSMLNTMRRNFTKEKTYELIEKIRSTVPDIALRTTLLVGHPGETEQDFNEMKHFVQDVKFDRLGVFQYSHEEGTHSFLNHEDTIEDFIKASRAEEIMMIQQDISLEKNQAKIGKTLKTIIDRKEGEFFVGRTEFDSYEVDNEVLIEDSELQIGSFYDIEITDASDYDLFGKVSINQ